MNYQCFNGNTEMDKEAYNKSHEEAIERIIKDTFFYAEGEVWRKKTTGGIKRVEAKYQVTLPGGLRVLFSDILRVLDNEDPGLRWDREHKVWVVKEKK